MKKIIILLFISAVGHAQISFGPKAGLVISSGGPETKPLTSFFAGGFIEFKSGSWAVQPEINYLDAGARGEAQITMGEKIETRTSIQQLNFSILAKRYFSEGVCVKAGGYYGTILSSDRLASSPKYEGMELSGKYKSSDYGLEFGIEARIIKGLFADAKYNLGLADLNNGYKTRIISLGIGYKF